MRYSKIPVIMLPFLLVGCSDVFYEDEGPVYVPAPAVSIAAPAPATPTPTTTPPAHEGCGCPGKSSSSAPTTTPSTTPEPCAVSEPDWHPLEGHLVRAGDLVMELKRSKGGTYPSHQEMSAHIQTKMGLTSSQAEKILDELGL